ncbi:MAG: zinc ABC transporter substrate-binding protein [Rubrobacteridae bacterium]|nr:zinc ABC transporter substrate-binding protein [Rubrobacteridae bacterium]
MNKKFVFAVIVVILLVAVSSFLATRSQKQEIDKRMEVTASFYSMAEFAQKVGGEKVHVTNMTPVGVEPHDFEPSPKDIAKLERSGVFVYTGSGFEPWADKVVPSLKKVAIINASEGIDLLPAAPDVEKSHGDDDRDSNSRATDPHFYLDPVLDQKVVKLIAKKFSEVDPDSKAYYEKNATEYINELAALDKEYKEGLANCETRNIVTSHAAFAYLAKRYDLNQVPIAGFSEEEPSPAKLAEIAKFAKENDVKYIFFEELVDPRLSETIAKEVGAKTLVLDPIEGLTSEKKKAGKDFLGLMRDNLVNLRLALDCK